MPDINNDAPAVVLAAVVEALVRKDQGLAELHAAKYPFTPVRKVKRQSTNRELLRIFERDQFTCRYFGTRLVFPGLLRALSVLRPDLFPFHANWKMTECHIMYWHLMPTADHLVPVALGGLDAPENLVTCSQLTNSAKSNWRVEDLGWTLRPIPESMEWDGLHGLFTQLITTYPDLLKVDYIRSWSAAAKQ